MKITAKAFLPTLLITIFLSIIGLYTYLFTDNHVFWGGYISMLFFYILIFGVGNYIVSSKSNKNTADEVMLAGRSMPLWIAVFTMSATWIGGGYINGSTEATFSRGLVWLQAPWGYALSLIVGGLFFAKKMRRFQFKTMLDPLAQRYGEKAAALFFLPALTGEVFWTAAILSALGSTFGVVLGIDFSNSIIISAIVVITYTSIGGLWAIALTDVFQLILLLVGLLITLPYVLEFGGGWDNSWAAYKLKFGASANPLPSVEALGSFYWNWWDNAFLLIFGGIPWQVYFQRVLAAKNEKIAQNLSFLAGIVCFLVIIPPMIIGVVGSVADWTNIGGFPTNSLEVLPRVMRYMTPPFIAIMALGAVSAGVMSSADSSLLSASSMSIWNIYKPLIKPNITSKELANKIKKCVWVVGIATVIIALQVKSIYTLWFLCSDFVYCLLFPALVCALFDSKANKIGALAGLAIAAIFRFGGGDDSLGIPVFINYPIINGEIELVDNVRKLVLFPFRTFSMISGLITIIVVSRLTQKLSFPIQLKKVD